MSQRHWEDEGIDVFICPVIVGSDSTHLTFSSSQKAHNVYVTPAVLHVEDRQKMDGTSDYTSSCNVT
jgi:hypothetical protein